MQIGNSVGFVLPKEAASRLKVEKGDVVFLTESPDGYRISPYDPAFEKQISFRQLGDVQQHSHTCERYEERRTAVGDQRERDAFSRHHA